MAGFVSKKISDRIIRSRREESPEADELSVPPAKLLYIAGIDAGIYFTDSGYRYKL
ncbi:MAG: hypothetical protein Kow0098_19050 [Ignavibacteriaceae bacterium]